MTSLSDYLEGVMRVPLGLLTSEGFSECPAAFSDGASVSDFKRFLGNRDQPITGILSPKRLDEILERLVITRQQLQQSLTQEPLSNSQFKIDCLLGQHCLEKAKELLGQSHECIVRIYSIPPELPGRYSDGEICRKVLLLHQQQPSVAQKWLERLSAGKRKHVTMVFHRDEIWSAMRQVAVFPGLWHDIKLGNWAKHLAAHIDGQITTYWRHIYRVWNDVIFNGVDPSLRQHLDAYSARSLQFMAPAWSEKDQEAIREKMKNGTLFCNISGEEERSKLLRNILAFEGVIPSILTFHENMRYLTVGAKILERYVEVKRPTEKAKPNIAPLKTPESLLSNLTKDWNQQLPVLNVVECKEGRYQSIDTGLQPLGAFAQLMLAALRSFPLLSSETPLQDIKGIGMNAFADAKSRSRLCEMASSVGFWNKKIEKGLALPDQDVPREIPDMIMFQTEQVWRGGLPTISVFSELRTKSFLPTLLLTAKNEKGKEPTAALIQFDFVCAFFGPFVFNVDQSHAGLSIEELRNRPIFNDSAIVLDDPDPMTDAPGLDITPSMDWAVEEVSFAREPLTATTNKPQQPRAKQSGLKTRRQKAMRDPSAKKPEKAITKHKPPKRIDPKNLFGKTPVHSVPEGMDTTLDNPEVPEASQRISTPQVDGLDIYQQGRTHTPPAEPPAPPEPPTKPPVKPPAKPPAEPLEIDPEVPESYQRISAPNLETDIGHLVEQQKQQQHAAIKLQQQQALQAQQEREQQALALQAQQEREQQALALQAQQEQEQQALALQAQQEREQQALALQQQQEQEQQALALQEQQQREQQALALQEQQEREQQALALQQQQEREQQALALQEQQQREQQALALQEQEQEQQQPQQQPRPQDQREALKRKTAVSKANKIEIRRKVETYMVSNKRIKDNDGRKVDTTVDDTYERMDDTYELEIPERPGTRLEAPAPEQEEEW